MHAPYIGSMDDISEMEPSVNALLDAMLSIPKAFICLNDTRVEVKVNLERSAGGYTPAVTIYVEGAIVDYPDTSILESKIKSKAVNLALEMEEDVAAVLKNVLLSYTPSSEFGYAFLEVDTPNEVIKSKLMLAVNGWVLDNTHLYY